MSDLFVSMSASPDRPPNPFASPSTAAGRSQATTDAEPIARARLWVYKLWTGVVAGLAGFLVCIPIAALLQRWRIWLPHWSVFIAALIAFMLGVVFGGPSVDKQRGPFKSKPGDDA